MPDTTLPDHTRDTRTMPVRKRQCATCVFKAECDGGIHLAAGRREEIQVNLLRGINQICHHGNSSICRGGRDFQLQVFHRMGIIDAPTDAALQHTADRVAAATNPGET